MTIAAIMAVIRGIPQALGFYKPLAASKAAAEGSQIASPSVETFDSALRRVKAANPNDSPLITLFESVKAKIFTPDFLRTQNVQNWLDQADVVDDLRAATSAYIAAQPQNAKVNIARLEARYVELALADRREARGVVSAVVALVVATINMSVKDPALASVVVAAGQQLSGAFETMRQDVLAAVAPNISEGSHDLPFEKPTEVETSRWRAAFNVASQTLLRWPTVLGDERHIIRTELALLIEQVETKEQCAMALLGLPGSGKSALLASLGNRLSALPDASILAIKGDLISASVTSEKGLQEDLALPELPSIMLRRLALNGPAILLVDQLDALAGHLDMKTARLNILLNLVKSVGNTAGIFVFVSCRKFEFDHDTRLSHLDIESVELQLPEWEDVLQVLEEHGVGPAIWNSDAREVLRIPQQLGVYLRLRANGITEPVSNYTTMLDDLWRLRVISAPGGNAAAELAFEIAERMAEAEELWVAAARYDSRSDSLQILISSGILTKNVRGAIGFSHQTVFEHVLARKFSTQTGGLSQYVLARSDSLFVRPKLWAGLAYLRDVEPKTYLTELFTIWHGLNERKHLRYLLIEFLGAQPVILSPEITLLSGAFNNVDLQAIILSAIVGSPDWFKNFEEQIILGMSSDNLAEVCIPVLNAAWTFSPLKVLDLVRSHWLGSAKHARNALMVIQEVPVWDTEAKEVAIIVLERSELAPLYLDYFISSVGAVDPNFAIEILAIQFNKEIQGAVEKAYEILEKNKKENEPSNEEIAVVNNLLENPSRPFDDLLTRNLFATAPSLAEASPSHFLNTLWSCYLDAFQLFLDFTTSGHFFLTYPLQYRVNFRFEDIQAMQTGPSSVLEGLVIAVEEVAKSAPEDFLRWTHEQSRIEIHPVQRLIAYGYTLVPEQYALYALNFLLADERRFLLGSISDPSSTTLRMVTACAPYWCVEEVEKFISAVTKYSPKRPPEKGTPADIQGWHRHTRRVRTLMLRALPQAVRSSDVKKLVAEGERLLAPVRPRGTVEFKGGALTAAMDATQFERASIADIIKIFRLVPDETGWDHPERFLQGGNIQLSQQFAEFAKRSPDRAAAVLYAFDKDDSQRAAGNAIHAMAPIYEPVEIWSLIIKLCKLGFANEEFKQQVALAIELLINKSERVPDLVVAILDEWVWTYPIPESNTLGATDGNTTSDESEKFLLSGYRGFDVLPGGVYLVLSTLVRAKLTRNELADVVQILNRYFVISKEVVIWMRLAPMIADLAKREVMGGRELIGRVLSLPSLDGTHGAAQLMISTYATSPDEVTSNLRRWLHSPRISTRRAYGELVTLIGFFIDSPKDILDWLDELIEDKNCSDAREGAAATAVRILWADPSIRDRVVTLLVRLLEKNEEEIWHLLFGLFNGLDTANADVPTLRLIKEIAVRIDKAPAPKDTSVVESLIGLVPRHAEIVALIASHLIRLWRNQLADTRTSIVLASRKIIDLAITLHRIPETREQGIQMFQELVEIGAYESRQVLDEIDNRLRLGRNLARPRLPRARTRTSNP